MVAAMEAIARVRIEAMLVLLAIICRRCPVIDCQLNLFDADRSIQGVPPAYDCLHYRVRYEKQIYQELSNSVDDMIPYCFRPANEAERPASDIENSRDPTFTFNELRSANVTVQQLLSWSASIDLVEQYQLYLGEASTSPSALSAQRFYNCTSPWFGTRCQYSFEFSDQMSMREVVENEFSAKASYAESTLPVANFPCYVHLDCDRGASSLCLDWREICDGRIDCLNGGVDEAPCLELEINECGENEYRCHNGLCIPEQFWHDGLGEADCLDRSDEPAHLSYATRCFQDPTFRCEEHSCRPNWYPFSCGDGQCVQTFDKCHNGRHASLVQSMLSRGSLSDECWTAMACLTLLVKQVNGSSCRTLLTNDLAVKWLRTCDSSFHFPTNPVHLGHIRLLYERVHLKFDPQSFLFPDYVCYDRKLCDCIIPTLTRGNLSCLDRDELQLDVTITGQPWIDMLLHMDFYFSPCLTTTSILGRAAIYRDNAFLHWCRNSSKFISKHRVADEHRDCCMDDDEDPHLSCSLNDRHRIKCANQTVCLSPLQSTRDCPDSQNQYQGAVPFRIFCDGFEEHFFDDQHGQRFSDESDCSYWPCDNVYSRCDGFWACANGEDEQNCTSSSCPRGTHPCVSSSNYSLICLTADRVGDDVDDCLGASDEGRFCRQLFPHRSDYDRFRCTNSDLCLSISDLCNGISSCPLGDDEKFCEEHRFICDENRLGHRSPVEDVLCEHSEVKRRRRIHFSLDTMPDYPESAAPLFDSNTPRPTEEKQHSAETLPLRQHNSPLSWHCNRGLTVRTRLGDERLEHRCMCPPSYYGHLCQFQSERVSLTIGLVNAEKHSVYAFVTLLIDDNDPHAPIDSYDQFDYAPSRSCGVKLNRYLLFSSRPKNTSKNYSVRIDAFEKTAMAYRGSWHFAVPFLFLPVNKLAVLLLISHRAVPLAHNCSLPCKQGHCVKYLNKDELFCRCFPGWSGVRCDLRVDCANCSPGSVCVGTVTGQPICVCPLTKFGPRCLLTSLCAERACENNGRCVPTDLSVSGNNYACICPDGYFGARCQLVKAKLDVSLERLDIPSYVTAFFFTLSAQSEPVLTVMLQKLTLFQRLVTFRIAVPYHLAVVQVNEKFYLGLVQKSSKVDVSTLINPDRECFPVEKLMNSTLLRMSQFQRVKYYHIACQADHSLQCFFDETYLCLCTQDHHANCVVFDRYRSLRCPSDQHCANGAKCLQDHPDCPSAVVCVCSGCFFGSRCQFYSKGLGLTLDEILGYEIKRNLLLSQQPISVKLSASMTMIMFVVGVANGFFSILTFNNKTSQEVGCGLYLLASSITSLLTVVFFTLKFWFLMLSHVDSFARRFAIYSNCMFIEPLLKVLLHTDNWLNGCVAGERAFSVFKGIYFDKRRSKRLAKRIIAFTVLMNVVLILPQLVHLQLFDDRDEERTWCVVRYSWSLYVYNSSVMLLHVATPFLINLFSAMFIILTTGRQRDPAQIDDAPMKQFKDKLKQHKHLLISPIVLVLLSLPRLIIPFTLDCSKSSRHFWLYLTGYFVSFMPSILVFVVFVVPSTVFKKAFNEAVRCGRRPSRRW